MLVAGGALACSAIDELGTSAEELRDDSWQPPDDVVAAAGQANLRYDGAPAWTGHCPNDGLTAGAKVLGEYLRGQFSQVSSVGGFSCRQNTANSSKTSVHGTGRALDVMTDDGDDIANWALVNAHAVGIQLVIWNHTIWQVQKTVHRYGGPNPHTDHVHIEINEDAANEQFPFFQNPGAVGAVPPRTDPVLSPVDPNGPNPNDPNDPTAAPSLPPSTVEPPNPNPYPNPYPDPNPYPYPDPNPNPYPYPNPYPQPDPYNPNPYPNPYPDPNPNPYPTNPSPNPTPPPANTGPTGPSSGPIPTLPNGQPGTPATSPSASPSARPETKPPPAVAPAPTDVNDAPSGAKDSLGTGVRATPPKKAKHASKPIEGGCATAGTAPTPTLTSPTWVLAIVAARALRRRRLNSR